MYQELIDTYSSVAKNARLYPSQFKKINREKAIELIKAGESKLSLEETEKEIERQTLAIGSISDLLKQSKVFKITSEQLDGRSWSDENVELLKLPFDSVFIEFDSPIHIKRGNFEDSISAVLVRQNGFFELTFFYTDLQLYNGIAIGKSKDGGIIVFDKSGQPITKDFEAFGRMVALVIATINTSKIERIEPGDVKGVHSNGLSPITYTIRTSDNKVSQKAVNIGTGTKHRYRYAVRGHFRKMKNGKMVWIDSHERGVEHEVFIKKNYLFTFGLSWFKKVKLFINNLIN